MQCRRWWLVDEVTAVEQCWTGNVNGKVQLQHFIDAVCLFINNTRLTLYCVCFSIKTVKVFQHLPVYQWQCISSNNSWSLSSQRCRPLVSVSLCWSLPLCWQRDESVRSRVAGLSTGDFYITRHSNLSEVHVVFHLVSDDSVSSTCAELTSRHPIITACRNILKLCFRYDVRHVTLPLLLVHEMTEVHCCVDYRR